MSNLYTVHFYLDCGATVADVEEALRELIDSGAKPLDVHHPDLDLETEES